MSVTFRVTPEELRSLDRLAAMNRLSRSRYIKHQVFAAKNTSEEVSFLRDLDARIASLEGVLNRLRDELRAVKDGVFRVLFIVFDKVRVPSFREFRARALAEGRYRCRGQRPIDYLIDLAKDYYAAYGIWPNVDDNQGFGGVPDGVNPSDFPRRPVDSDVERQEY